VDQDPKELRSNILEVLASFIAAGVDYKKQIIFQQSSVPAHSQLAWVFNCVSRIGWLNRMTQFKDKAGKNRENVSVGLMVYPNLMAADILAYLATHVPVGDDQKQHLELSRDIAQKFNNDFGVEFFPQPEPLIYGSATRVMSLRDGNKKMSKSDPSDFSRILLTDDDDTISAKIRKAKSDSELIPSSKDDLQNKPECLNLINILSATTNQSIDQVLSNYAGKEYSALKKDLAESLIQVINPIRSEINNLLNNQDELNVILADGTEKAAAIANPIIEEVYKIVGFK
jgi:tryptophanyl-tRNA synthetase